MNATRIYTEQDVRDAWYAHWIDGMAQAQGTKSAEKFIYEDELESFLGSPKEMKDVWIEGYGWSVQQEEWNLSKPEDKAVFEKDCYQPQLARYHHGKEILQQHEMLASTRWMAGIDENSAYDTMAKGRTLLSPAIEVSAGHRATTECFRWVVLAEKKGSK